MFAKWTYLLFVQPKLYAIAMKVMSCITAKPRNLTIVTEIIHTNNTKTLCLELFIVVI